MCDSHYWRDVALSNHSGSLETMLEVKTASNSSRFKLLQVVREWATVQDKALLDKSQTWITSRQLAVLKVLDNPVKEDVTYLVGLAAYHGGIDFLKTKYVTPRSSSSSSS